MDLTSSHKPFTAENVLQLVAEGDVAEISSRKRLNPPIPGLENNGNNKPRPAGGLWKLRRTSS